MAKIQLFSEEALGLVKNVKKEKKPVRHKGTITLSYGKWACSDEVRGIKEGERYISVSFNGYNEGSSCGFKTEQEAFEEIKKIQESRKDSYSEIKIIDEEHIRFNSLLNKWKDFIVNLCKEKGQEIEIIWFDKSAPFDCEVSIRMKGHRCWNSCVDFRFQDNKLKAYDSGFGGGTSFVGNYGIETDEEIKEHIKAVMEKVFDRCCEKDYCGFYKVDDSKPVTHRELILDERGGRKVKYTLPYLSKSFSIELG